MQSPEKNSVKKTNFFREIVAAAYNSFSNLPSNIFREINLLRKNFYAKNEMGSNYVNEVVIMSVVSFLIVLYIIGCLKMKANEGKISTTSYKKKGRKRRGHCRCYATDSECCNHHMWRLC